MLAPALVVLALAADAPDRAPWKDISPPEGYGEPVLARIFDPGLQEEAARLAGIVRDLFPDSLRATASGGRVAVVGSPRKIEFLMAILDGLDEPPPVEAGKGAVKEPPPPGPEAASRLRSAIGEALGDLRYTKLPPASVRTVAGDRVPEQTIEFPSAALEAYLGYIGRVKAAFPGAEVHGASFSHVFAGKPQAFWQARLSFIAVEGLPGPGGGRPRNFPELYGDLRGILDASGVKANLRSIEYASERGSLTVSLSVAGIDDQRRLEGAIGMASSPLQMVQSSVTAGKKAGDVSIFLEVKPREGSPR